MTTTVAARQGLPITITAGGGAARGYVPNIEAITWLTVPPTRQGADQGAGPGEQSLSNEVVWRRSRESWHLGAGQEYADTLGDTDEDVQRLRFYTSTGCDPWTKRGLGVLPTVELIHTAGSDGNRLISTQLGGVNYLTHKDSVVVSSTADPEATVPTWTTHTGMSGGVKTGITTDGRRFWVTDGSDVWVGTPSTAAMTAFSTYNAGYLGYANGRLLASSNSGPDLVELDSTGTAIPIFTHPNPGFVWKGFVPSPSGIYVFGDLGDTSEIFVITAIDTTGGLDVPFVVAPWPQGEQVRCMCSYAGVMIIGTTRGIRLALITGGGFLSYGPLIDEPGEVRALEPQLEDVWFTWGTGEGHDGVGRLRLSRFVEELVPAFATDLVLHSVDSGGWMEDVATVGTRRYMVRYPEGVYAERRNFEANAEIDLGWFSYGIPEPKVLDSLAVWCDPLPSGATITARVYDDSDSLVLTMVMSISGITTQNAAFTGSVSSERYRVRLTVTTNGFNNVIIRRVTVRAAPKPFVSERVTIPLYLGSVARDPSSEAELGMDPYEEWVTLHSILMNRERCTVTMGAHSFDARIEALEVEKGGLGGGNGLDGMDDRARWVEGAWEVSFVTLEPTG